MACLRVFGVLNHLGHQYEMLKLARYYDVKFDYLLNNIRRWGPRAHRPEPTNWLSPDQFEWVTHYEPGKYDLAVLHVDQQHVNPDLHKGQLYRDLNDIIHDIPKIVINHGTPMYPEMYDEQTVIHGGEAYDHRGKPVRIMGMREKVGDNFMIVNSYTAAKRWGWGYPLIHGLDAQEWWDLPKETRVVLPLSPAGLDKYYNRELVVDIKRYVRELAGLDVLHTNVNYQVKDWCDYRTLIGSSLISLAPYKDSPMPRSRTEAMLSGACVLSSRYHDVELFIEHGVNGFIMPDDPLSYAETIYQLVNCRQREAVEIGNQAKKTALKHFTLERYHRELWQVLTDVANGRRPTWDGKTTIYSKDYA